MVGGAWRNGSTEKASSTLTNGCDATGIKKEQRGAENAIAFQLTQWQFELLDNCCLQLHYVPSMGPYITVSYIPFAYTALAAALRPATEATS